MNNTVIKDTKAILLSPIIPFVEAVREKMNCSKKAQPEQHTYNDVFSQAKITHKSKRTFWTPVNTIFITTSLVVFLVSTSTIFSSIFSSFTLTIFNSKVEDGFFATSLPWVEDKFDCEHRGKTWNDGKCWDEEHSPMF